MSDPTDPASQAAPEGETALTAVPVDTAAPQTPSDETPKTGAEPEVATAAPEPDADQRQRSETQAAINKRIGAEVAKRREAERRAKALEEMVAARAGTAPEELPSNPAEIQRMIETRATELARNMSVQQTELERFNARCNEVATAGAEIPTFRESVATLQNLGVMDPARDFMRTVVALKAAPQVLDYLGRHADLAIEIADLSPHQLAGRLADIASEVGRPKPVSRAPAPVRPVQGSPVAVAKDLSDAKSDAEWLRIRREQRKARWGN